MYRLLVGAVVSAVRVNLNRYFHHLLVLRLVIGVTASTRYFTSLDHLWQHLETCIYSNAYASPPPPHGSAPTTVKQSSQSLSSIKW